jgi:hypothetical protein
MDAMLRGVRNRPDFSLPPSAPAGNYPSRCRFRRVFNARNLT